MQLSQNRVDGKRTKIVATIGPASSDEEVLRQIIRKGMNVARINFSHGDHETHGETIDRIRRIAAEENAVIAIMCDLQGPKIRIGKIAKEPLELAPGDTIRLTLNEKLANNDDPYTVLLPHPEFVRDIEAGMSLLLDDGNLEFVVREVDSETLVCEVIIGGNLTSRKGVTAPTAKLTLSAITEKDRTDVEFALKKNADYIAMSFVRSEEDLRELRWLMRHLGGDNPPAIVSKIEKHEALENIEAIIESSDAIMVARGDLGVETPAEEVPVHQKRIIRLCNIASKPVITATQMLNSMVDNARPTRAEASDVYNAIMDGTDAVMLSNETAMGNFPVVAVETMATIAVIAEQNLLGERDIRRIYQPNAKGREVISDAISQATSQIAEVLQCKAIVTSTLTGYTARRVAKERPRTPIICVTPSEITFRRMALVWGVIPMMTPQFHTIDEMITMVVQTANNSGLVVRGDSLVIIAGVPFGVGGQTNFLKLHIVGESGEL
ncbi:MAG: pyruvate kinase [Anaerolineaceae bacterium]|nr:pyruvate kinase [Anaerolineaceae bacterium]